MRLKDLRVGSDVAIRQWDDMASEFGITSTGCINCYKRFTEAMRCLCGEVFTVKKIEKDIGVIWLEDHPYRPSGNPWLITADMLEPVPYAGEMSDADVMSVLEVAHV